VIGNAVHVMRIATGEIEDTGTEKNGATSSFFMPLIASNARFASSPAAASASVSTARRDLPGNAPLVFAPAALAFLPPIADDGIPVEVGLNAETGLQDLADGRCVEQELRGRGGHEGSKSIP
jgi:hypothetical protein